MYMYMAGKQIVTKGALTTKGRGNATRSANDKIETFIYSNSRS